MWWIYGFVGIFLLAFPIATVCTFGSRDWRLLLLGPIVAVQTSVIGLTGYQAYPIAHEHSKVAAVSGYLQDINGNVVDALDPEVTNCDRDGDCEHTESCDPYMVVVSYAYTDKDNIYHPEVDEWRWHQCPQATQEFTYKVVTYDGLKYRTFVIASHIFAANPKQWRRGIGLPSSHDVHRGVPTKWQQAKDVLAQGDALPSTALDLYDNFVLGSEQRALEANSPYIDKLKKAGLLPMLTINQVNPTHDWFVQDKMQFVGMPAPANTAVWQDDLMRLNSALGMTLQGDLDMVAVDASKVQALGLAPEDFITAVKANSQAAYGKRAMPKNAILVAIGVDPTGTMVQWARATTGMPIGNNPMTDYIANRFVITPLADFTPEILLGKATATVTKTGGSYKIAHHIGNGVIAQAIMVDQPFERACMKCTSANDKQRAKETGKSQVGFVALRDLIPVSTKGIVLAILTMFFISLGSYGIGIGAFVLLTGAMVYPYLRRRKEVTTLPSSYHRPHTFRY